MIDMETLLKQAVEQKASDVFITVGTAPIFKINGELVHTSDEKLSVERSAELVKSLFFKKEDLDRYLKEGELDFSISLQGVGRFRISAYTQRGSMAAVIRVLRFDALDLDDMNIPEQILDFYKSTKGLILVTGATGSGKSTTLTAIINRINRRRSCHILTLEDPIEYLHRHDKSVVNQREIGIDTESYSRALRSALRQSPDVILIGEMRDHDTVSIALTAAETGHLVLSTLHTTSASKTIDRILDVFTPDHQQQVRIQLATTLQAVISQQLIPSVEGSRVPAFEIMIANSGIRNLIRDSKVHQIDAAIQTGRAHGMISMDMSVAELYNQGKITKEVALDYCTDQNVIMKYFKK